MATREELEKATWDFLVAKGLPELSTAAVMGNIEAESSFDPNNVEVGNSIGFGLCQWSFGRRDQLESYGTSLNHQLEFLWAELSGENNAETHSDFQWINKSAYLSHAEFMSGTGTLDDLTSAFCFSWERPAVETAHLERRQTSALGYFTLYTGSAPIGGGGGGNVTLKNNYLYNATDSWLGRKFISSNTTFEVVTILGDKATIKDGNQLRNVPKKNLIY